MIQRYLFRPVALPSFKHEDFQAALDEKLERIFTKILQAEPARRLNSGNSSNSSNGSKSAKVAYT
jgi:hypothetical protein